MVKKLHNKSMSKELQQLVGKMQKPFDIQKRKRSFCTSVDVSLFLVNSQEETVWAETADFLPVVFFVWQRQEA